MVVGESTIEIGVTMRTHGHWHQAMVCLMLGTAELSACTSWQVQTVSPTQVVATEHPKSVRVQRLDGSRVVLGSPVVSADSLVGAPVDNSFFGSKSKAQVSIPLADIHQISVKKGNALKTVGFVIGVIAGVIIILGIICEAENCTAGLS